MADREVCCFPWLRPARALERRATRKGEAPHAPRSALLFADEEALPPMEPITAFTLNDSMFRVSIDVQGWRPERFILLRKLQDACRNHGRVDVMWDTVQAGDLVAVKRMPNWWIGPGPEEFWQRHPREPEQPWCDLGMLRELGRRQYPYACRLRGVFADVRHSYVVTDLAEGGDLHAWSARLSPSAAVRESEVMPVAARLCTAVWHLHELGVAHRDVSLENVVVAGDGAVKLIDFGMAAIGRIQGSTWQGTAAGKRSYCAPEVRARGLFDAFLADTFSVGVILYCLTLGEYPWADTRPGTSTSLERAKKAGMAAHLADVRARGEGALPLVTRELEQLLGGVLEPEPTARMCLGESCLQQEGRRSARESPWLVRAADRAAPPAPSPSACRDVPLARPGSLASTAVPADGGSEKSSRTPSYCDLADDPCCATSA